MDTVCKINGGQTQDGDYPAALEIPLVSLYTAGASQMPGAGSLDEGLHL